MNVFLNYKLYIFKFCNIDIFFQIHALKRILGDFLTKIKSLITSKIPPFCIIPSLPKSQQILHIFPFRGEIEGIRMCYFISY